MPSTDTARLAALHDELRAHLEGGLVPFWAERAVDHQHGGYLTNFDGEGRSLGTPEKYLNTQCRLLWWFSALHRARPGLAPAERLAHHGAAFLYEHFWDTEHGGWYWKVARDGAVVDDGKIVYGQSFAVYALAEYALATGDGEALARASATFDLLHVHAADTRHGGYLENLRRDWSPEDAGFAGGDRKGLDTHMHLVESFTTLLAASGRDVHRRPLLQLVDLVCARMVDRESGAGLNQFALDLTPIPALAVKRTWNAERHGEAPADPTETTSYGHNVELEWLLARALETAGAALEPYVPVLRGLLDHAVAHGVDREHGGVFRDGLRQGGPLVLEKEFWQQAESLVGFLDGYERFGDERYLDAFERTWRFVADHMLAPAGEWRTLVGRDGRVLDWDLGNPWKVAYHSGRSMLESIARLERLLARPG